MDDYYRCDHGQRIGLDDCEQCSVDGLRSQLKRLLTERNEARSKLASESKIVEAYEGAMVALREALGLSGHDEHELVLDEIKRLVKHDADLSDMLAEKLEVPAYAALKVRAAELESRLGACLDLLREVAAGCSACNGSGAVVVGTVWEDHGLLGQEALAEIEPCSECSDILREIGKASVVEKHRKNSDG